MLHKSPRGLAWRKVAIAPEHLDWQESRYGSGLHPSHTQESWDRLNPQPKTFCFEQAARIAIASLPPEDDYTHEFSVLVAARARQIPQATPSASAVAVAVKPAKTAAKTKTKTRKLVNYPAQTTLTAAKQGTKTALLIDLLGRSQGASMTELLQHINPKETSVRAYFGYDLKKKGYGCREDAATGRFHLVLPNGFDAPLPHANKGK